MAKPNSIPTTRRSLMAGGLAAAVLPIAATGPVAAGADFSVAGCLARTEAVIDHLRTRYICEGWHGRGLDEEAASRTLDYFRRGMPDDDPDFETVIRFFGDHGQSLDLIFVGDPHGMICHGAANSRRADGTIFDPVLPLIENHRSAKDAFGDAIDRKGRIETEKFAKRPYSKTALRHAEAAERRTGAVMDKVERQLAATPAATLMGLLALLDYQTKLATQPPGPYYMFEGDDTEYLDLMRSIRVAIGNVAVRLGLAERLLAHGIGA